jgi:hypothetical protein
MAFQITSIYPCISAIAVIVLAVIAGAVGMHLSLLRAAAYLAYSLF